MKKKHFAAILICLCSLPSVQAQMIKFNNQEFDLVNVKASVVSLDGENVLKVERNLEVFPFDLENLGSTVDESTFLKLKNVNIENGIVEVKVLSRIQNPSPFEAARGFIGLAYRINEDDTAFESIYIRPANGRSNDQIRRNHTIQYFAYPNYKFFTLRNEMYKGQYESYADIGLDEWITIRIEFIDKKVKLYLNNQEYPSFIVAEMLGSTTSGSIGLWVEIGTEGYFKDLKFIQQ